MKLAEALILRADTNKRIEQVRARIMSNVQVQEGEKPVEDPDALLKEFEGLTELLTSLMQRINRTNTQTEIERGKTLTDALAERDTLALKIKVLQEAAAQASQNMTRYSRTEIKMIPAINVKTVRKKADDFSKQLRELDTKIQSLNWQIDLVE